MGKFRYGRHRPAVLRQPVREGQPPAKGEEDAEVTLRLTITKGRYASGSATAKTVNFVLTVPAITDAEYEEAKAAVDAALSGVTLEGFTESGSLGETAIDPDALDFDVQLKSVANLISAGMIEDNAVNRSMEYGWSTSGTEADGNYLKINSLRCNVIRTVGAGDTETDLILTLTYNGYSGSKSFPVTIRGLTQQEVDDANAEMEEYEAALWDGLKGENTDSAFVASDLGWDRDNGHVVFTECTRKTGKSSIP